MVKQQKKIFLCADVLKERNRIQVLELFNYFNIEISNNEKLKEAIDTHPSFSDIQTKDTTVKQQKYFLLQKGVVELLNCEKSYVKLLPNFFINNEFICIIKKSGLIDNYKILLNSIDDIIDYFRLKNVNPMYPKNFKEGKKLLLLVAIWTDEFASFLYSNKPTTSLYIQTTNKPIKTTNKK